MMSRPKFALALAAVVTSVIVTRTSDGTWIPIGQVREVAS